MTSPHGSGDANSLFGKSTGLLSSDDEELVNPNRLSIQFSRSSGSGDNDQSSGKVGPLSLDAAAASGVLKSGKELEDSATVAMGSSKLKSRAKKHARGDDAPQRYVYKDYSRLKPTHEGLVAHQKRQQQQARNPESIKTQKLPAKLDSMLSNPEYADIIKWLPHGRAWKVVHPQRFLELVTPQFFEYGNYNSFVRLVNAWGFRRITTGPDRNGYWHELFLRGLPHLHIKMHRLTPKEKKLPVDPEDEPDLYRIAELFPLTDVSSNPTHASRAVARPSTTTSGSTLIGMLAPPSPASLLSGSIPTSQQGDPLAQLSLEQLMMLQQQLLQQNQPLDATRQLQYERRQSQHQLQQQPVLSDPVRSAAELVPNPEQMQLDQLHQMQQLQEQMRHQIQMQQLQLQQQRLMGMDFLQQQQPMAQQQPFGMGMQLGQQQQIGTPNQFLGAPSSVLGEDVLPGQGEDTIQGDLFLARLRQAVADGTIDQHQEPNERTDADDDRGMDGK